MSQKTYYGYNILDTKIYTRKYVGTLAEYKHLIEYIKAEMNEKGITDKKYRFLQDKLAEHILMLSEDNYVETDIDNEGVVSFQLTRVKQS